ncbi:MAG TPA: RAD55 family ATPase [Candidatus Thermoplasmatota archaeon]|nr:RAD55 family ATPase [Candidatus Thermoplasmatota archaeon]
MTRRSTGARRLDEMLEGGIPAGRFVLVHGPPFVGKDVLARRFLLEGVRHDEPALVVLTDTSAREYREELAATDPDLRPRTTPGGHVRVVDAFSRQIGVPAPEDGTEYVDGAMNLNGISAAVNHAEHEILKEHEAHRVSLDSVSTLLTYVGAPTAFRFLQVLVGRASRAGATGLLMLDAGMHTEAEVQMMKHLVHGILDLKAEGGRTYIRAEGAWLREPASWVEYRHGLTDFEVVGSTTSGRIR